MNKTLGEYGVWVGFSIFDAKQNGKMARLGKSVRIFRITAAAKAPPPPPIHGRANKHPQTPLKHSAKPAHYISFFNVSRVCN
jgi:hypothetical protein